MTPLDFGEGVLQDVGPVDVDAAGELVRRVGVHNQAKLLIKSVTDNFPPELVAAGSRRLQGGRSQTLDLAEVRDAAQDAFDDYTALLSAKVRGTEERPETMVVNVVCRAESGRSFRGIIAYDDLKKSKAAYDEGIKNGTITIRDDDPESVAKALEKAQQRIVQLESGDGDGDGSPAGPAEPFDGYGDLKASELVSEIEDGDYSLSTLIAIRTFEEEGGNPRETVVDAATELITKAEAALDEPAEDDEPEPFEGYADISAPDLVKAIEAGEYDLQTLFAIRAAEAEGKERTTVQKAVDEKIAAAEAALKPAE